MNELIPQIDSEQSSDRAEPIDLGAGASEVVENSKITIVEMLYYQTRIPGDGIAGYDERFAYEVDTQEQPYERSKVKVGEEWKDVDYGWVEEVSKVSEVRFINQELQLAQGVTPEELAKKILNVGFKDSKHVFKIRPGQSLRLPHSFPIGVLRVRSEHGVIRMRIFVTPG